MLKIKELQSRIFIAQGERPGSLLLKNGRLVNIFTGEIYKSDVLILGDTIAGIGTYSQAQRVCDLKGSYILPGLIESHIHIESSLLSPREFSRATILCGTTSLFCDPHEIANVLGIKGIYYLLRATKNFPQDFYFLIPSCVPATKFETAGAKIGIREIKDLIAEERIFGLAEVMNFPGVVSGSSEVLKKIGTIKNQGSKNIIDGHCPALSGKPLQAYLAAGISSDHECATKKEALEKLRSGMWIMIREGSAAKNLEKLAPLINDKNSFRLVLCSDDKEPQDLLSEGHLDAILRKGVWLGIDPILLIRMVTISPATYFGLKSRGAVAPGYKADITIVKDLKNFEVVKVIKNGKVVVENKELLVPIRHCPPPKKNTFKVGSLSLGHLRIKSPTRDKRRLMIKVIGIIPDEILTKKLLLAPKLSGGDIVADIKRDILKLVVIERHKATGRLGLGFVQGFGLKDGAIGSSVAHDSHNIIIVGVSDEEILRVAKKIKALRGGMVVSGRGKTASLALPIAGLLSDRPAQEVVQRLSEMISLAHWLGAKPKNPFATLSFLSLPVIPELKLTDFGLFDSNIGKIVPLTFFR